MSSRSHAFGEIHTVRLSPLRGLSGLCGLTPRPVGCAQFHSIVPGGTEPVDQRALAFCGNLGKVLLEVFEQHVALHCGQIGQLSADSCGVGCDVACLVVTCHDCCSSRSADG